MIVLAILLLHLPQQAVGQAKNAMCVSGRVTRHPPRVTQMETRINNLLRRMTLTEKLGQMSQGGIPDHPGPKLLADLKKGLYGSLYGGNSSEVRAQLQLAAKNSRLHIPLLIGNDVIHGFRTGLPIPLAQAATFDPALVQACARTSAREASSAGIDWTFSPMMDIARDPRWGRIAEGYGEDPYLASQMAVATMRGYQNQKLSNPDSIAACGKHYVGYGAAEAGRDYNSTWIPENLLRDVYLKPFQACAKAGIASFMSAFNAINGVPATGNALTLRQILRKEWGFDGMVVSDYAAVAQMVAHGYAADGKDAALKAIQAGVDMEMISRDYATYGPQLVREGKLDIATIDGAVRNILRTKFRLGLFDGRPITAAGTELQPTSDSQALNKRLAAESLVLLKNDNSALPLSGSVGKVAIVGPLADRPQDQLGSWSSADAKTSVTPLAALKSRLGENRVLYAPGIRFEWSRDKSYDANQSDFLLDKDESGFPEAFAAARQAEVIVVFLGELSSMSGEAASRSSLDLPGAEAELVNQLAKLGKPIIGVVMAGRPLTMSATTAQLSALLYTWHAGALAGPAIVDTLFGDNVPSGKLPVTFPRSVGQIPIYYDHLRSGRPELPANPDHYTSRYLDIPTTPEYPFGFGLSYTTFRYSPTRIVANGKPLVASADITNTGKIEADEVVQFYVHQKFASVARPVRELKGFRRIHLQAGETKTVSFTLNKGDLAFWNQQMKYAVEPGQFEVWVAPDSVTGVPAQFTLK